ncbi:MAG: hypothetical protein J5711_09545 [Bacteroidales bacterium]|nr:hypothetical protein [Bacteroidales bacterium]
MKRFRHIVLSALLLTVMTTVGTTSFAQNVNGTTAGRNIPHSGNDMNDFVGNSDTLNADTLGWQPKGIEYHEEIPDTTLQHSVFMFRYDPQAVKIKDVAYPSLDPTGVQYHDALDAMNGNYYLSRGVFGQQHLALYQTFGDALHFRMAPDVNIGYRVRPENLWLIQTKRPYTSLSYASSLEKEHRVLVSLAQNVMPRWNFAFDYKLINPSGNYSNSSATNHYLDATTNYYTRDARYQVTAGIIWEKFRMDENGGITNDSIFRNRTIRNEGGVPVLFTNMGSIDKNLTAFAKQTFNTVRPIDRYRRREEIQFVGYDTIYSKPDSLQNSESTITRIVPIYDTVVKYDTIAPFRPMVINTGVFGMDVRYDREKHVFVDSTVTRKLSGSLYWTNDAYWDSRWRNPLKIMIGVKPTLMHAFMYNGFRARFFALNPMASVTVDTKIGMVSASIEKNIADNYYKNGYRFDANLKAYLDSLRRHVIRAEVVFQGQDPELIYHNLVAMSGSDKKLGLTNIQKFEAGYSFREWLDWSVTARHIVNNIWIEDSTTVVQNGGSAWLFQSRLNATLHWKWFHYDMQHLFQYSTDQNQVRVPLFATKNSIYADVKIFKGALRAQFGIDLRYHTAFYADAYNPYTSTFYRQNDVKIGNYIWGDIFINLQVKRASIFFKAGHLNALWEGHPNYYLLPHYPGNNFGFYYGMIWKFFD